VELSSESDADAGASDEHHNYFILSKSKAVDTPPHRMNRVKSVVPLIIMDGIGHLMIMIIIMMG